MINRHFAPIKCLLHIYVGLIIFVLALIPATSNAAPIINEYPLQSTTQYPSPLSIIEGSDNALWFTENNANKIGRITTAGDISEYSIPTIDGKCAGGPEGITAGSDGALWFNEAAGINDGNTTVGCIGRVSTSGNITLYYDYPISPFIPEGNITAGPDGNLYFTGYNNHDTNYVGRITTAGDITLYPVPYHSVSTLQGITAGPDGALWFTDDGNNAIERITTDGHFSSYPIHTTNAGPNRMASGPDGALWFTEARSNQIGRISMTGDVTEYAIPIASNSGGSSSSNAIDISSGPDGALWFTEMNARDPFTSSDGIVGRITTSGSFTEYAIANPAPFAITSGPDGGLWFTRVNGAQADGIGELRPESDNIPPIISSLSWSANPLHQGQSTTLSASVSDNASGVSSVQYSLNGGIPQSMIFDPTSNTWQATFGSSLSTNTYAIEVTATDAVGSVSSAINDVLAVYTTTNGYVTGHAKILPATSDIMPIPLDISNNPAKLTLGFTNVVAPTSGSFSMDYSIKNDRDEFSLSSTGIEWVIIPDSIHANILSHADLTIYANGAINVVRNVTVRFDISLASSSGPANATTRIYNPGVDPGTGSPAYIISDDIVTNGSNIMIHP